MTREFSAIAGSASLMVWIFAGCDSAIGQVAPQPDVAPDHTLLIIYASELEPAAREWAAYRQSTPGGEWRVELHTTPPTTDAAAQRQTLRQFIRQFHADQHGDTTQDSFAVLLLGDADPQGIPTWTFPQNDPVLQSRNDKTYVSDHPYQLLDDRDDAPDFALGRVPARTLEEARTVLSKIKRYESLSSAATIGRNRINYVAGEGHFGAMDNVLESMFKTMVDQLVPEAFDLSMTYAKASSVYCPPPSQLTETVLGRMSEGAVLFNYVGHGFATGLDSLHWNGKRFPILKVADLKRLPEQPREDAQIPIAFMSCCSVGWYDLAEGKHSLAEAMLFHPSAPVAVISGSRITHPYANTVLQMDITRTLLNGYGAKKSGTGVSPVRGRLTVGMLDLLAEQSLLTIDDVDRDLDALVAPLALAGNWKTSLKGLRKMHVKLYNLLGDPAMRIALPKQVITDLSYEPAIEEAKPARITGRIQGMKTGRVSITAESPRIVPAKADKLQPVLSENDPELESKAANNYPIANDRVLMRYEGEVVDGRFRITMTGALPASTAVLRAYAFGVDAHGLAIDGVGALCVINRAEKALGR